jgi:hypothetical protein
MSEMPGGAKRRRWQKHIHSEILGQGVRVRPTPKRAPSNIEKVVREPAVFAGNLRNLISQSGLTEDEAWEVIGVERRWLRRVMKSGLRRIDRRSHQHLKRVAHYFGLKRLEDLWEADLPGLKHQPAVDQQILSWSQKANWPYARKLLELLATGEHEFLKGLIDSLHTKELPNCEDGSGAKVVPDEPASGPVPGLRRRIGRKDPSQSP